MHSFRMDDSAWSQPIAIFSSRQNCHWRPMIIQTYTSWTPRRLQRRQRRQERPGDVCWSESETTTKTLLGRAWKERRTAVNDQRVTTSVRRVRDLAAVVRRRTQPRVKGVGCKMAPRNNRAKEPLDGDGAELVELRSLVDDEVRLIDNIHRTCVKSLTTSKQERSCR